jgi:UDP-N-acetyl-D-glucosamine dehydrogenase
MSLKQKIEDGSVVVGVIGLGYVGLPLARAFVDSGLQTLGFDVDPAKIDALAEGRNYLTHLGADFAETMRDSGRFEATSDFARLSEADAILACVPTPLGKHNEPDLSYVEQTTESVAAVLREGQLVVLESTTYPSTTRDVMLPVLEAGGLECGRDFYLAYSPEREDPGRQSHDTQTIPKLVGGIDPQSGELATMLYRRAVREVIPVSSAEVAEAAKLLENIYRSVNIALVNEMKLLLTKMDIDVW